MSEQEKPQQPTAAEIARKLADSVYMQPPTPETDLELAQVYATLAHTEALEAATQAVQQLQGYLVLSGAITPGPVE